MADISAILNGHREGLLFGPSIASFREAIFEAQAGGISVESIIVLDRANELTVAMAQSAKEFGAKIILTDVGDPGQARNAGVAASSGSYVTFLDGDDLWSFNWLSEAYRFCRESDRQTIAHCQAIVAFGLESHIWMHLDSQSPDCDLSYLALSNYWDALSFTPREIFEKFPFRKNDIPNGVGHEDWDWNNVTVLNGFSHRPVPHTVHFKRKRANSQMSLCANGDAFPWITELSSFDVADALNMQRDNRRARVREITQKKRK